MIARATLLAALASDADVADAARVSGGGAGARRTDVDSDGRLLAAARGELDRRSERLIATLMGSRPAHGSPFEHTYFRFHVVVPIFAQRDWMRHRAGHSFNEVSTRWQSMDALGVYEPERLREQVGRPWEYRYVDFDPAEASPLARLRHWRDVRALVRAQERAMRTYRRLVRRGVAREQAMAALPMGTYTEFWWSCNARSLMHFLSLRADGSARREIRAAAAQVEEAFAARMPVTHREWVANGRVAP